LVLKMVDDAGHSAKEHGIRKLLVEVSSPFHPSPIRLLEASVFCSPAIHRTSDLCFPGLVRPTRARDQTSPVEILLQTLETPINKQAATEFSSL
jgi:hypothetical protein